MCTPYICLARKQYLSIIIANPCIRNCDNMNCDIWKLVSHKYSHPLLQPIYTQLYNPFLACWKAKEVDQKEKAKEKTKQRRKKKWCSTFHSKIMWSGWWVVITTGGYLCARIFVSKASRGSSAVVRGISPGWWWLLQ